MASDKMSNKSPRCIVNKEGLVWGDNKKALVIRQKTPLGSDNHHDIHTGGDPYCASGAALHDGGACGP